MFTFVKKLTSSLSKTTTYLGSRLKALFVDPLSEESYEKLEQILYEADLGSTVTHACIQYVRDMMYHKRNITSQEILEGLASYAENILTIKEKEFASSKPHVILVVGINGSGKTTSIAKLASYLTAEGKKVLVAAADTFRAGAVEQLEKWAIKLDIECVKGFAKASPAAVVYDALSAAVARNSDVVIIDTAGRLHNKTDLMHELEKMRKVCQKVIPGSPQEILFVLDATTGQNGVEQAKTFHEFTPLTGIILSKLDGSAKGGVALSICQELKVPVKWIGLGEQQGDFAPFDPKSYARSLFDLAEKF